MAVKPVFGFEPRGGCRRARPFSDGLAPGVLPARCCLSPPKARRGWDRIEALQLVEGPAPNFNFIVKPLNMLDRRDVDALLFALGEDYEMVVIDTLGRLVGAAGADENTSDMQRLVANLDIIRDRSGVQLVLIHHAAKTGSSGPRGHGSLVGACDAVVEHCRLGDGSRTATVISTRDNAPGLLMRYRLRPICLPPTRSSPSRSAVICEEVEEVPVAAAVKSRTGLTAVKK